MKWEELIKSCATGKLPKVKTGGGVVGQISVIKDNGRHRGVGVMFHGLNYDTWYHDSDETDKRSKYIRELTLIQDEFPSGANVLVDIWNAAITIANNECSILADKWNDDDDIEMANAAVDCAKEIRQHINNPHPDLVAQYNAGSLQGEQETGKVKKLDGLHELLLTHLDKMNIASQELFDEKKSNPKNKKSGLQDAWNKLAMVLFDSNVTVKTIREIQSTPQSPEHKSDREPEEKGNFNTDLLNKCTK